MIIDTQQSNVELYGDIKEFKTSIDPKNLEFITTLLSSNLYSDPEQSFIREIVSNAWDSHVEAGTTDKPVIISVKNSGNLENCEISIRDYGTGISPERFKDIYINIGSSTKRDSNDYIGGFGIGKFSALACSNTVHITSYYNGIAYKYIMIKDGNVITTNLISELPTSEHNGVDVSIKVAQDKLNRYYDALSSILFFPNIYINYTAVFYGFNMPWDNYNKINIKRYNNFAVARHKLGDKYILLGNVLYPCNKYLLSDTARQFFNNSYGVALSFDIGELPVTPNRENIIYTPEAISKIEKKVREAMKEITELLTNKIGTNITDLKKYAAIIYAYTYFDLFKEEVSTSYYDGCFRFSNLDSSKFMYRGEVLSSITNKNIQSILSSQIPTFRAFISSDKVYIKKVPYTYRHDLELKHTKSLIRLKGNPKLGKTVLSYLRENYENYVIIKDEPIDPLIHLGTTDPSIGSIINDYINEIAIDLDLENNKEFLEYKEALKEKAKANRGTGLKSIKNVTLHELDYVRRKRTFDDLEKAIQFLCSLKKGILLCSINDDVKILKLIANRYGYRVFQVKKDLLTKIRDLNLSFVIDQDWLLYKNPKLSELVTIDKVGMPTYTYSFSKFLTESESKYVMDIINNNPLITNDYNYYSDIRKWANTLLDRGVISIDQHLYNLLKKTREIEKEYYKKCEEARELTNETLAMFLLMKDKKLRPSRKVYENIKNNKIIKILCKK